MSADSSIAAATAAARLAVDVRQLPWMRPLTGEYAFDFSRVTSLYAGDPTSPEAWREAAERVTAHPRPRQEMAACLGAQQGRRGAPPAAREAAARLADPRSIAVVTGQQAGVFGGPLYTLLKALTAIQVARRAEAMLARPVVPVFWVDAEDHDWNEIASCTVLDERLQPRTLTLAPPEGAGDRPVASLALDDRVGQALDALEAAFVRTDFTVPVIETLRAAYRAGTGMADAFARWMDSVLGPYGLVVYDSSDPAVKPLVSRVFATELATPGRTAALAAAAGQRFAALGHAPQVVPQEGSVSLFRLDGTRQPIRREGDQFLAGEERFTADALAHEAVASPDRFSPNVLLRPIVQDTLFPTVCYVAGPSELAYLGQLRDVYAHFGLPMPLIHPRATATLVDSATARFLTRYDLPLQDLQQQDESALNRLLQAQLPPTVETTISDAESALRRAMEHVSDAVLVVDPTLAGAAQSTLSKMEHELRVLHGKVIQAAKKRDDTLRRQFIRAQAQTFPQGDPQERTLAVVFFLNLYGPALIDRLLDELPLDIGHHWVLAI